MALTKVTYSMIDGAPINVLDFGAVGDGVANDTAAIQAAIDAAELAGGGVVYFPGDSDTRYGISSQITVNGNNIKLYSPGRAKLKILSAFTNIAVVVNNIETGLNTTQNNTLSSNANAGAVTVTLSSGKGANFTADTWAVIRSTAAMPVYINSFATAEFIHIYEVNGDVLTLDRPLRYNYTTAASAQVNNVNWTEGFELDGLGIDGNNQTPCGMAFMMSWCIEPKVSNFYCNDLEQRTIRFQGCVSGSLTNFSTYNSLSSGTRGAVNKFGYAIAEAALNEGFIATQLHVDRTRHAYTTLGNFVTNNSVTAPLNFGEPFGSIIADGVATNMFGTGWDTHENGNNITFQNLKVIGGLYFGFVDRTINTRIIDCESYNTLARAFQAGGTSVNCQIINFKFNQSNQGIDAQDDIDWTQSWPINVRGGTFIGPVQTNSVLNSNIDVWTGGTSGFTTTGETADDWYLTVGAGATVAVQRSNRTLENGVNSKYYLSFNRTVAGSADSSIYGVVSDVRSFTSQTVNVSFDLRSNMPTIEVYLRQYFGSGGSPSASVDTSIFTLVADINFRRGSIQFDLPSIVGKTIGTSEDSEIQLVFVMPFDVTSGTGSDTIQIDRVKIELANVPTQYIDTV